MNLSRRHDRRTVGTVRRVREEFGTWISGDAQSVIVDGDDGNTYFWDAKDAGVTSGDHIAFTYIRNLKYKDRRPYVIEVPNPTERYLNIHLQY